MKQLLVFLFLLCSASVFAQDVIVKKDGSTIVCRVVELTSSEIVYKKWSDLNGSNYVMNRADASAINYQDGKKVNLSEVTNLYQPHNQNDGVQQYNDRALLALDASISTLEKKVRKLRATGWIGGAVLVGTSATFLICGLSDGNPDNDTTPWYVASVGSFGAAVTWTTIFLLKARKYENEYKLQTSSVYRHSIPFANKTSIDIGADLICDHSIGERTLGLGLQYNF